MPKMFFRLPVLGGFGEPIRARVPTYEELYRLLLISRPHEFNDRRYYSYELVDGSAYRRTISCVPGSAILDPVGLLRFMHEYLGSEALVLYPEPRLLTEKFQVRSRRSSTRKKRWNPNLFCRVADVQWGEDRIGRRLPGILSDAPATHIAQLTSLHFDSGNSRTSLRGYRVGGSWRVPSNQLPGYWFGWTLRGCGLKTLERIRETLAGMGVSIDMGLAGFPWEQLA